MPMKNMFQQFMFGFLLMLTYTSTTIVQMCKKKRTCCGQNIEKPNTNQLFLGRNILFIYLPNAFKVEHRSLVEYLALSLRFFNIIYS